MWQTRETVPDEDSDLLQSGPAIFRRLNEHRLRNENDGMGCGSHNYENHIPCHRFRSLSGAH
jgi:hypothetical protein